MDTVALWCARTVLFLGSYVLLRLTMPRVVKPRNSVVLSFMNNRTTNEVLEQYLLNMNNKRWLEQQT